MVDKYSGDHRSYKKYSQKPEFDRYRVKSPIKTFRDLEVYQKTIQLSEELTSLAFLTKEESTEVRLIAQQIPQLIAQSYGDKYDSRELAHDKLTQATTHITNIITRLDLLREKFSQKKEEKEILDKLLTNYSIQKRKVLNLRKAWDRVFTGSYGNK